MSHARTSSVHSRSRGSLEFEERLQLLDSVFGARNGVADCERVMEELIVVASRVRSVAEEVDSFKVLLFVEN